MARDTEYDPQTMVVKEIEELLDDLDAWIRPKLPGNRERRAVSTAIWKARETIRFAKFCLDQEEREPKERLPALTNRMWEYHGQIYAVSMMMRAMADELGISNFKPREVSDAEGRVGVERQGQVDCSGPGEEAEAGSEGVVDSHVLAGGLPDQLHQDRAGGDQAG
jgi:hypothetical protein